MISIGRRFLRAGPLFALALVGSGCIYGATGSVISGYASEHLVPYMMSSDDVGMACQTGVSMGSFLMSFERVAASPDCAALVSLVAAGMCAESKAWDAELRRLRAGHDGRGSEAQDALSEEKQAHSLAAVRFFGAYRRLVAITGPLGEACPKVSADDELYYVLGLSAGVLAVMHDKAADGAAGVPTDIPATVQRAADCVAADRWWGVPTALKAAIWVAAPPLKPADKDPWTTLAGAVQEGDAANVRLSSAFLVQAAVTAGRGDEARKAITAFAAASQAHASDPKWKLLDAYGASMILHESDKIWTEDTGHRTPFGQLGTFQSKTPAAEPADDPFKE